MTTITRITRPRTYQIIRPENGGPRGTLEAEFSVLQQALAHALAHCGSWHIMRDTLTGFTVDNPAAYSLNDLTIVFGGR